MKHKLINIETKEIHLCEKIKINGFDYYCIKNPLQYLQTNDKIICDDRIHMSENPKYAIRTCKSIKNGSWIMTYEKDGQGENPSYTKKVIATTNPNIDCPKVVDEAEYLALSYEMSFIDDDGTTIVDFKEGYNKAKETYSNSDEDMIEFAEWKDKNIQELNYSMLHNTKELLQLWKEQKPKTIYFN